MIMAFSEIEYSVDQHVATITLDRPDRMNAFTTVMCKELIEAFDQVDADDDVRAVIVTGRGRAFCAGADLGTGGDTFDAKAQTGREFRSAPRDTGGLVTLRIYAHQAGDRGHERLAVGRRHHDPADGHPGAADSAKVGFCVRRSRHRPRSLLEPVPLRAVGINQALEWCLTAGLPGPGGVRRRPGSQPSPGGRGAGVARAWPTRSCATLRPCRRR
jgi:hypothetical protein